MFLSVLEKKEKEVFLDLVLHMIHIDGSISLIEKNQFSGYLNELGLQDYDIKRKPSHFNDLLDLIKNSSERSKKVICISTC